MSAVETINHNGCVISIHHDEDNGGPREWDNLGVMVCFHRRYRLGDASHGYSHEDYSGWAEMERAIRKEAVVVLPLYLYDHSGLTIATTPFSCPWDSGQVGFIFATRKAVLESYGVKRLTKQTLERARKSLVAEVEEYDKFLRGDVYYYVVERAGERVDSCGGFYGLEAAIEAAKEAAVPAKVN